MLYLADSLFSFVRVVDTTTGNGGVVAGTGTRGFSGDGGPAGVARLDSPSGLALDQAGNLFVADSATHRIRKISTGADGVVNGGADETIATVAGNGTPGFSGDGGQALSAALNEPSGLAVDKSGNLFVSDSRNARVRKVVGPGSGVAAGTIVTVVDTADSLINPVGLALDSAGHLFIADYGPTNKYSGEHDGAVRRLDARTGGLTSVVSQGTLGVAFDAAGNLLIATDHNVRRVVAGDDGMVDGGDDETITTVAGTGATAVVDGFSVYVNPVDAAGDQLYPDDDGRRAIETRLAAESLAFDAAGNLYVAVPSDYRARKITPGHDGVVDGDVDEFVFTAAGNRTATFSGDGGPATEARMASPSDVALDPAGNLFVADTSNHRIRKIDALSSNITTVAGRGPRHEHKLTHQLGNCDYGIACEEVGPHTLESLSATSTYLSGPRAVALDGAGNLFFSDTDSQRVMRVDALTGAISTAAGVENRARNSNNNGDGGPATSAYLFLPGALALNTSGDLFIADSPSTWSPNASVRRVDAVTGTITSVAPAQIANPKGLAVDRFGNLLVATADAVHRIAGGMDGIVTGADDETVTRVASVRATRLAVDYESNLYLTVDNTLQRIDADSGEITTVAGTGTPGFAGDGRRATAAMFSAPRGLAIDGSGNLLVADTANDRIRKITQAAAPALAVVGDFGGDGVTDHAVFRPSDGTWYVDGAGPSGSVTSYGTNGDIAVAADYDGDSRVDHAVFRPSQGLWYIRATTAGDSAVPYGTAGDIPVPGDYDGDNKADIAVFRPSDGTWYLKASRDGDSATPYGTAGDIPVPADYDGDDKADIAVFRPSDGTWYMKATTAGDSAHDYGTNGDIPVPADYDGDTRADVAVFRPADGTWYLKATTAGHSATPYGTSGDIPLPGNFDQDDKADVAVFRPSDGTWYTKATTAGHSAVAYGTAGDVPAPLPAAIAMRFFS